MERMVEQIISPVLLVSVETISQFHLNCFSREIYYIQMGSYIEG